MEAKFLQSQRIYKIYQSYFSPQRFNKILGIAMNYGDASPDW